MLRYARNLIVIALCTVIAGGIILLARPYIDTSESFENLSGNDQALYAEVSTSSVQELPRIASSTEKLKLPILVYHIVRPAYPGDSRAVRTIALTPEIFSAEMAHLAHAGYHIVSFGNLEDYFQSGKPLPSNPIILSFDDGWSDQFKYAFPILKKNRLTATFFVFTNSIGHHGFLSWDKLRTLLDAGMTIGSHTRSHPYLTTIVNTAVLWDEINGSKEMLEKNLNVTIDEFAYPFGTCDAIVVAMVKKAGYRSARGDYWSGEQTADRIYELSAMNAPTTTALFEKKFP